MMNTGNLSYTPAPPEQNPGGGFAAVPLRVRFEKKYERRGPDECWPWVASLGTMGSGQIWVDGAMRGAHRIAYELYVGEIPEGMVVSQTCRNRVCMNPAHLELRTSPRPRPAVREYHYNVYNSSEWRIAREAALLRDGRRCTVARFFGETCNGVLHVHHIVPLNDGGEPFDLDNLGTACARHHAQWEALRGEVVRSLSDELRHRLRCPHQHRSAEGRRICEARLARRSGSALAA